MVYITPAFIASTVCMTAALLGRLACYRELGQQFTFELSIKKDHRLVTSGPYAFVRHPSYTACILHMVAALVAQLGHGSWWYESGKWGSWAGRTLALLWLWLHLKTALFFLRRVKQEDEMLQREFGGGWDEWCKNTPYKLIPWVW
jgi:protein-S-isoprenylcysteine O-methyltransferase Ste14